MLIESLIRHYTIVVTLEQTSTLFFYGVTNAKYIRNTPLNRNGFLACFDAIKRLFTHLRIHVCEITSDPVLNQAQKNVTELTGFG